MRLTPGYMEAREIGIDGRRYWGTLKVFRGGCVWLFWSDHKWPFFHASYTQRVLDRRDAYQKFLEFLPFKVSQ